MKKTNTEMHQKQAIILFTRIPIPGITKTRLEKVFTPEECAKLHCCFLEDQMALCEKSGRDWFVFYEPLGEKKRLVELFGTEVQLFVQKGDTLGERMLHALSTVLEMDYDACVLMGSDIPELQVQDLEAAFEQLQQYDVVLGPTADHGYCLVGMKQPHLAVFESQDYSERSVMENTVSAIVKAGLTVGTIQMHEDIDEPEDILGFQQKVKDGVLDSKLHSAVYIDRLIEKYRANLVKLRK